MGLLSKVCTILPRESSGARTANRYSYQQNWAICHALHLYQTTDDFLIVLEQHDDVLVLNSEANPKYIDIYQIKTKKEGTWSAKKLLSKKSAKENISIIGKLYENYLKLGECSVNSLNVVSNLLFKISLQDKANSLDFEEIPLDKVKENILNTFRNEIQNQLKLPRAASIDNLFVLIFSRLSLHDQAQHMKGYIYDFIQNVNPEKVFITNALYGALLRIFNKKTLQEFIPTDTISLIENKCISRNDISRLLTNALSSEDSGKIWHHFLNRLNNENYPYNKLQKIEDSWRRLELLTLDISRKDILALRTSLQLLLQDVIIGSDLSTFIDNCCSIYKERHSSNSYPDSLIQAAILRALYDQRVQLQTSYPESQEEYA